MCLAVVVTPGGELRPETCRIAAQNNPDGFGYAFCAKDLEGRARVFIRKALTYAELEAKFWEDFDAHGDKSAFLVHWRLGTHGLLNAKNAHPYRLKNGGALVHNGILDIPAVPKQWSDTRWFVRAMLNKLPDNWQRSPVWQDVVREYIGGYNKIAGLWADESLLIVNEKDGEWRFGAWHSNDSGMKVNDWRQYVDWWENELGEDYEQRQVLGLTRPSGTKVSRGVVIHAEDYESWQEANEMLLKEMEEEEGRFVYAE